ACLPDGERGAGVDADEGLLDRDGIWDVTLDEIGHAVEDRLQPHFRALARERSPPPVVDGPEAPVAFVDDPVSACSRAWVDAEDFHGEPRDRTGRPRSFAGGFIADGRTSKARAS